MADTHSFPQELLDEIVSHLHDDTGSLRSCSLAARSLLVRSQRSLFSSIILSSVMGALKFERLVISSPHLCAYVERLDLEDSGRPNSRQRVNYETGGWLSHNTCVSVILLKLTNLKRIQIRRNAFLKISWTALQQMLRWAPERTHGAPDGSFHAQSLTHLGLRGIENFPLYLLRYLPSLKHLTLSACSFVHQVQASPRHSPSSHPTLKRLSIEVETRQLNGVAKWILESGDVDIRHLEELHVRADRDHRAHAVIQLILQACSTFLRCFNFSPSTSIAVEKSQTIIEPINLTLPNLQSLHIHLAPWHTGTFLRPVQTPIPWLMQLLETCRHHQLLEAIYLWCKLEVMLEFDGRYLVNGKDWRALDALFAQIDTNPPPRVHLMLYPRKEMEGHAAKTSIAGVKNVFTRLAAQNRLYVEDARTAQQQHSMW